MATSAERLERLYGRSGTTKVKIEGLKELARKLDSIGKGVTPAVRRSIAQPGATLVARETRKKGNIPERRASYVSSSGRVVKVPNPVTKYSRGRNLGKFMAGNLRKSIRRIPYLRKSPYQFVGPMRNYSRGVDGRGMIFGQTVNTSDGYYAAMMAGSKESFYNRYLAGPAMAVRAEAQARMIKKSEKVIQRIIDKEGF